jgi:uncharacterized protein (TIGR00251 family)
MTRNAGGVSTPSWLRVTADSVTIEVLARPGSPRRGVLRVESRGIVIGIGSPAEKGKANDELIATVAEVAEVPRSAVSIIRGVGARTKVVRIAATDPAALVRRLTALALGSQER